MQPGHFVHKKYLIPMIIIGLMVLLVGIVIAQAGIKLDGSSSIFLSPQPKCIYSSLPPTANELEWASCSTSNTGFIQRFKLFHPLTFSFGTSYQVAKINDLAINMPDQEKTYIYVMHCDGSIELFKVISSGNINNDVPFLPYDFILDWIPPASLMGSRPLTFNTEASVTQLPITGGYPPPPLLTFTPSITPSPISYP